MTSVWRTGLAAILMGFAVSSAEAGAIMCLPSNERVATLSDASACGAKDEFNINTSADVNEVLGTSYAWTKEGEVAPGKDAVGTHSNDLLTITLDAGDKWGGNDLGGAWGIDPSFWLTYGTATISMHVGQGQGGPDAFAWLITPGQTSGWFTYKDLDGKGGGLSNMFLFGTGTPTPSNPNPDPDPDPEPDDAPGVPEPGGAAMVAIGIASVAAVRAGRRPKK